MKKQTPLFHYFWKKQDLISIVNIVIKKPASFQGDKATHSILCFLRKYFHLTGSTQYLKYALKWRLSNTSNYILMDPKSPNPNPNFFLFYITRRHESSEGLDSSLAQSAAHLWQAKICPEGKLYLL